MRREILYICLTISILTGCKRSDRTYYTPQEHITYPSNVDNKYTVPTYPTIPRAPIIQEEYIDNSATPDDAYQEGYDNGYEQGKKDGRRGESHGYGYDDSSDYYNYFETRYIEGYEEGYEDGYRKGSDEFEDENNEDDE